MTNQKRFSDSSHQGNVEVRKAIDEAKTFGLGSQADKGAALANALASLNVAESLQDFQMVLGEKTDKLIESNKRHSMAMILLTGALVFVGAMTAMATFATSWSYIQHLFIK